MTSKNQHCVCVCKANGGFGESNCHWCGKKSVNEMNCRTTPNIRMDMKIWRWKITRVWLTYFRIDALQNFITNWSIPCRRWYCWYTATVASGVSGCYEVVMSDVTHRTTFISYIRWVCRSRYDTSVLCSKREYIYKYDTFFFVKYSHHRFSLFSLPVLYLPHLYTAESDNIFCQFLHLVRCVCIPPALRFANAENIWL